MKPSKSIFGVGDTGICVKGEIVKEFFQRLWNFHCEKGVCCSGEKKVVSSCK